MTQDGGELRRNPASGKLAIVAPGRATRPADAAGRDAAAPPCPSAPATSALTPPEVDALRPAGSVPDRPGWRVRVVPNKYPALAGRHEVIVHSPEHGAELEDLGDDALAEVLGMWQRRIAAQLDAGAAAVTLIANVGAGSGASLEHPHEQLFATPVVPPLLSRSCWIWSVSPTATEHACCAKSSRAPVRGWCSPARWGRGCPRPGASPASCGSPRRGHQADFRAADTRLVAPALRRVLAAVTTSIRDAP